MTLGEKSQIWLKFCNLLKTKRHPEQERMLVHVGSLMGSSTMVTLHSPASPWLYRFPLLPGQTDISFPVMSPQFLGHAQHVAFGEDRIQLVLCIL